MILEAWSGGQTGADQGGLFAGKKSGLKTGGWAPFGWKTETGPAPWLGTEYGLKEHPSSRYQKRTEANVANTDGTIRFAISFYTAGEICTLRAIEKHKKTHIDVHIAVPIPTIDVITWIINNDIKRLNVAGNRESTHPGICQFVEDYMLEIFDQLGFKRTVND